MQSVIFSTGNSEKFNIAHMACKAADMQLTQSILDIPEIQGEDPEVIIRDKVQKAFDLLGKPVIVSDDSWNIPGLNGFPGAYMKSIDHWFTSEDFLNLTRPLEDRRIILVQMLAYQDSERQRVFRKEYTGSMLTEARGDYGKPIQKVISMPGDNGLSVSEVYDQGAAHTERPVSATWHHFIQWYQENIPHSN